MENIGSSAHQGALELELIDLRKRHRALSEACHSFLARLGMVVPGQSRDESERANYLSFQQAVAAHADQPCGYSARSIKDAVHNPQVPND